MHKVLLVEDNRAHAQLVIMGLKSSEINMEIQHVENGPDALEYLKNNLNDGPELILLDLRMPKMDGLEVLEQIKKEKAYAGIPVIILTTSESEKDLLQAYKNRANSYLVKPISFSEMSEMLRETAGYWLTVNRRAQ